MWKEPVSGAGNGWDVGTRMELGIHERLLGRSRLPCRDAECRLKPTIRKATRRDARAFLDLLVGLANFEHLEPPDAAAKRRIVRDIFSRRRAFLYVATLENRCVGYALYFYTYSSFLARPTLYLEDIFVGDEFRGRGIGHALFMACVGEALKQQCGRMEWAVLTWNLNAIRFYETLGATRLDDWYTYRLTSEAISRLYPSKSSPASAGKTRDNAVGH